MKSSKEFFEADFFSTLFPMDTCRFLIQSGTTPLEAYIEKCLNEKPECSSYQFVAQTRVYASKQRNHLRRTVKLDPVAEYFLYNMIYKNRSKFRKPFSEDKKYFGYRFEKGSSIPASASYKGFKQAISAYSDIYDHSMSFDVASYFNGLYHHDIVAWFANTGASVDDVNALGTFLRQSNSGRSIDCWPQGIYPAKMVGNDFLRFVEQYYALKSPAIVRFMDDFYLFSNSTDDLVSDFHEIQKLLGQKGLSVNPTKTKVDALTGEQIEKEIDDVKANLLAKRRIAEMHAYLEDFDEALEALELSEDELEYIRNLLKSENLQEEDVELILSVFREHTIEVKPHLANFTKSFPHLAKNI